MLFNNNSQHIICTYKPKRKSLKITNQNKPIDIIDIMSNDSTPVVNWFGKLSDHDKNVDSLLGRVYSLIEGLSGSNGDASSLKNLFDKSGADHIIITGTDMSFWFNKMLSRLCTSRLESRGFFERSEFLDQIDTHLFLESIGENNYEAVTTDSNNGLFEKAIRNLQLRKNNEDTIRNTKLDIFISYVTEDIKFAQSVALVCLQLGYTPYICHEDDRYAPHWQDLAGKALNEVNFFLIIGTESYITEADKGGIGWECRTASRMENVKMLGMDFKGGITSMAGVVCPMLWKPIEDESSYSIKKLLIEILN